MPKSLIWTAVFLLLSLPAIARAQQAVSVTVEKGPDGYKLLRGGEPYFIKGAGGSSNLEDLVEAGGNSLRTWGPDNGKALLDRAHELGLTVTMGIWLGHERHGFDYSDTEQVNAQREMVKRVVRELKDHPALLMWGLGNEVALVGDPRQLFPEIEAIAKIVKELDPNHPTMTVIAGYSPEKMGAFMELCPSIDIIGVNKYGGAEIVPASLDKAGYSGPYIITEFGPRGWWESPTTQWGAQIEPTSAEKAEMYGRAYDGGVLGRPEQCLGCYVFLWGQKQEATHTWFGMFLEDGSRTPVVDVMQRRWTGEEPANRCPIVSAIDAPELSEPIDPGSPFTATVIVDDADDDPLTVEWLVMEESRDRKMGGDAESVPPAYPELTKSQTLQDASILAPVKPGAYRLFVTVKDGHGNAGTANLPFFVGRLPDSE